MISEAIQPLTREALFIRLYQQAFPATAAFVRKMGGSFDDARDVFQDALVIYYEKKAGSSFEPEQDDAAYLTGIAKHLWYKKFNDSRRHKSLQVLPELNAGEAEPAVSQSLLRYVERSGKKCLELLTAFYYDKLNMKELAAKFGFSGGRSAAAQKHKCLEKVRHAVKERSLTKTDFYE